MTLTSDLRASNCQKCWNIWTEQWSQNCLFGPYSVMLWSLTFELQIFRNDEHSLRTVLEWQNFIPCALGGNYGSNTAFCTTCDRVLTLNFDLFRGWTYGPKGTYLPIFMPTVALTINPNIISVHLYIIPLYPWKFVMYSSKDVMLTNFT